MDSANESITWTNYLEAGERAFEFGRYADAEKLFQKALIEARKQFTQGPLKEPDDGESSSSEGLDAVMPSDSSMVKVKEHPSFAEIYLRFGDLYRVQGNYSRAEEALKLALSVQEKCFGENAPEVAFTLNKLGQVFRAQGKFSEVEPYYRRALSIYEDCAEGHRADHASTLEGLADFYRAHGKFEQAEPLFRRAIELDPAAATVSPGDIRARS